MIMPEPRDRLVRDETSMVDITSLADLQAFAIQRGYATLSERRRRISGHGRDLFGLLNDDKENISPEGLRLRQYRRSPLPLWYPRTPLRDITHIVNALERQRSRQRAIAQQRRRNQEGGSSSPVPSLIGPSTPEPSIARQHQVTPTVPADDGISSNPAGLIEVFVEVADSPDNHLTMNDRNPATGEIAPEKKCLKTADEIERVVSGNQRLREGKPVKKKIQRSTLMMMR